MQCISSFLGYLLSFCQNSSVFWTSLLIACHIICQYLQSLCLTVSLNFDVEFKNNFEYTQLNKQTNSEARRIKVYHSSSLQQDIRDFWASRGVTIYKHFNDFTWYYIAINYTPARGQRLLRALKVKTASSTFLNSINLHAALLKCTSYQDTHDSTAQNTRFLRLKQKQRQQLYSSHVTVFLWQKEGWF